MTENMAVENHKIPIPKITSDKFFRRIEMAADQPSLDAILPLRQFYFRVTDRYEVAVFRFE
ncbi:MAG: hypothetical protein PVI65_04945 [Desulfobacterales bacterium]